jgi:hypothetical protein
MFMILGLKQMAAVIIDTIFDGIFKKYFLHQMVSETEVFYASE